MSTTPKFDVGRLEDMLKGADHDLRILSKYFSSSSVSPELFDDHESKAFVRHGIELATFLGPLPEGTTRVEIRNMVGMAIRQRKLTEEFRSAMLLAEEHLRGLSQSFLKPTAAPAGRDSPSEEAIIASMGKPTVPVDDADIH